MDQPNNILQKLKIFKNSVKQGLPNKNWTCRICGQENPRNVKKFIYKEYFIDKIEFLDGLEYIEFFNSSTHIQIAWYDIIDFKITNGLFIFNFLFENRIFTFICERRINKQAKREHAIYQYKKRHDQITKKKKVVDNSERQRLFTGTYREFVTAMRAEIQREPTNPTTFTDTTNPFTNFEIE